MTGVEAVARQLATEALVALAGAGWVVDDVTALDPGAFRVALRHQLDGADQFGRRLTFMVEAK